jgi:hypothetical protein
MQAPLVAEFGYQEDQLAHQQVLNGTYKIPAECAAATEIIIDGLKLPQAERRQYPFQPRTQITTEDHIRCWKKQKERTSGGASVGTSATTKHTLSEHVWRHLMHRKDP